MADSPGNPDKAGKAPDSGTFGSAGRRRLLRAGIASAPVVLTVLSRPVLANGACQSPSGFASGNVSNMASGPVCTGRGTAYWQAQSGQAPSGQAQPAGGKAAKGSSTVTVDTKFNDVFLPDLEPPQQKFSKVLNTTDSGQLYVARLCVAAVLNIDAGWVPPTVLTKITVQQIWKEYAANRQFSPTPAIVWNEATIIQYLLTTMPIP